MRPRVLIIDNEWAIQAALNPRLNAQGIRIDSANDGPTGLIAPRVEPPDVILQDLRMPDMDGLDMRRHLQAEPDTARIPVIFLTANVQDTVRQQAFNAGASGFLTKPFESEAVLAEARKAVGAVTHAKNT